jgi:predicted hotdog family 3-hydroxylacyl-ACP dehydratase
VSVGLEILPDPALFEGHFPGRPILPGVALIELAVRAIVQQRREPVSLRGVSHARLRQPVVPGDRLWLAMREEDGGRLRIDLQRTDPHGVPERIADGELLLGPRDPTPAVRADEASRPGDPSPPPLDLLLPHRPPMRFVSAIVRERDDGMTCAVSIPQACALVADGTAPALAAVEAAAQTAAVWEALRRARGAGGGGPRVGYLVALRDVVFFAQRIRAGEPALARVRLEAAAVPLTHYRFDVSSNGAAIAGGSIATYLAASDEGIPRAG